MSWGEVKKLNSDLSTPLNLAALINHIDLVGDRYVGWDNEILTKQLVLSDSLYNHSIAAHIIGAESLSTQAKADSYGYIWLCKLANTPHSSFSSLDDVLSDSTAMTAIVASETAMTAIGASETAMNAIAANAAAMTMLDTGNKTVPDMTSNTTPSGIAAASSVYAGYAAYMLFDRGGSLFATAQGNYANQWVSYTFPNKVLVYRAEIERYGDVSQTPKNYILQYSEDGTSWENAASGNLPSTAGLTEFTCTRSKAVRYWRFFFPESYGTTYIHVNEAQMYGREFV